jgi:DNA polymerase II large subunit
MKLSESLKINSNNIRIREFSMAGQSLKVRVPLASEMEAMNERVKNVGWEDQYKKMTDPLIEKKETLEGEEIQFTDNDVILNGKSTKELAKVAAQTNARIVEMFKLLVPVVDGADLSELTYEDIESEFPFSVQLDVSKKIAEVISPGYEETRKN